MLGMEALGPGRSLLYSQCRILAVHSATLVPLQTEARIDAAQQGLHDVVPRVEIA